MQAQFARDVSGAVRGEMLAMALTCLLEPDGPWQAQLIRAERVNHEGFGVPGEVFASFLPVVMETCRELAGPDWNADVEAAWTERLARLEAVM